MCQTLTDIKARISTKYQKEVGLRSFSLGTRITLIILLGTFTTVGSVLLIAYGALVEDFETILTDQQLFETRRISEEVDQRLQLKLDVLAESAATLTDGDQLLPTDQLAVQLDRQKLLRSLFPDGILVFDEKATAIVEDTFVPNRIGTNYADRAHFRRALETGEPVISQPVMGRTTGVPLLSFVGPILSDGGDILGFLGGTINLGKTSIIPENMLREIAKDGATFKVIDVANSLYIEGGPAPSNQIQELPAPGVDPFVDAALSVLGFGITQAPDGEDWIFATNRLQRLGWMFFRAVPYERATAPAWQSFLRFLGISSLIAVVIGGISFLLSRNATTPLERMTRKIRRMVQNPTEFGRLDPAGPREVRNLAHAFNQLMDEREAISQMKEQFVSNVSHELRTPLTSLNGALRLVNSGVAGVLPEKALEMNRLALRNGERLQLLISDLLDFNKLAAGQMNVSLEPQRLAPIFESAIDGNQTLADEHEVTLKGVCPPKTTVVADDHRLRQILDNFISNAVKFSPAGGTVTLEATPGEEGFTRIGVRDQGDGVPKSFVPYLFERFSQAESGTTRSVKGTGLGLSICRELTLLMRGHIGYEYKQGGHFWIELPSIEHESLADHESAKITSQ
jgi:signal transduction histidine kinase